MKTAMQHGVKEENMNETSNERRIQQCNMD